MAEDNAEIVGDAFEETSLANGLCGWIDLLGTKDAGFSRDRIRLLINIATIVSSNMKLDSKGMYRGVSNARANVLLVGDAICISQKSPTAFKFARDAVALVTLFVSHNLFLKAYPHRGALAMGSIESGEQHGIRYVSGTAVMKAIAAEKVVKTTGIVVLEELHDEAEKWQVPKSEKPHVFKTKFGKKYLTSEEHLPVWRQYCEQNEPAHPYIASSLSIFR